MVHRKTCCGGGKGGGVLAVASLERIVYFAFPIGHRLNSREDFWASTDGNTGDGRRGWATTWWRGGGGTSKGSGKAPAGNEILPSGADHAAISKYPSLPVTRLPRSGRDKLSEKESKARIFQMFIVMVDTLRPEVRLLEQYLLVDVRM
jgi:hypothetical protein